MINPNNLQQLANSLEDVLEVDYINVDLLARLTERQRHSITSLIYQWSLGSKQTIKEPEKLIVKMLDSVKPKSKYRDIPKVKEYLKIKQL